MISGRSREFIKLCENKDAGRSNETVKSEPAELSLLHESDHHLASEKS
jgi:hypothetical protein